MTDSTDKEGDEHGDSIGEVRSSTEVDVSTEEMVDGDVPFTTEFKPVAAIPPVGIEMSICEAGNFGEGAEEVFEDYEEDEEEGYHEGEEEHADGFG